VVWVDGAAVVLLPWAVVVTAPVEVVVPLPHATATIARARTSANTRAARIDLRFTRPPF
jgi:hypothetical protein